MRGAILIINVGNTNTTAAVGAQGRILRRLTVPTRGNLPSLGRLRKELFQGLELHGAILASVVPAANAAWEERCAQAGAAPFLTLDHRLDLGVRLAYPRPETLGADRLANICAAAHRHRAPVIAVDIGTAATFDVVTRKGFVGGVIAPGPELMLGYLADRTAKLPRLRPAPCRARIGTDTESAMRVGAQAGYPAMIGGILDQLCRIRGLEKAPIVITGGAARDVCRGMGKRVLFDRDLTLLGLLWAFELSRPA